MGLRSWLERIIPDEWSVKDVATAAGVAYLGFKAPSIYSAAKGFIGQPSMISTGTPYAKATGLRGFVDRVATEHPKVAKFVSGFGQQVAGQAFKGETVAEVQARYDAQSAQLAKSIKSRSYNIPGGVPMQNVGTFQASQAQVPGFKNARINESLNLMAYFMQDLRDNGRIDSSALYAESTRGTTIKLPSAKSMKLSI